MSTRPLFFSVLAGAIALASASFYVIPSGGGSGTAAVADSSAMSIAPVPDLTVGPILKVTEDASQYSPTLSFTVTNNGSGRARGYETKVNYHYTAGSEGLTGGSQFRSGFFGLNAGTSREFFVSPLRDGINLANLERISVTVDWKQAVEESREDNNTAIFNLDSLTNDGNLRAAGARGSSTNTPKVKVDLINPIVPPNAKQGDLARRDSNGLVHISNIYPPRGAVGTVLTIRGSGFTKSGNTVVFDTGYIMNVPSDDLTTLRIELPADRVPLCALMEPRCALAAPYNLVTPGDYKIYVGNRNGWSRERSFAVVPTSEAEDDPYKPVSGDFLCKELASLLPGCYMMPENPAVRFDSTGTKYVYQGTNTVLSCATKPVIGCKSADDSTQADSTTTSTNTTTTNTSATNSTSDSASTSITPTSAAASYRSGLYFKSAWVGCMQRLGSSADAKRLQEFLNSNQIPPPWSSFTGSNASNIATCEREAGWSYEAEYGAGGGGYSGSGTSGGSGYTATNWKNHTWRFKDGSTQFSSILDRSDSQYTEFITSKVTEAAAGYFNGWTSGAGDQSNWQAFGVPMISTTPPAPGQQAYQYGNNTGNTTDAKAGCESAGGTWNSSSNYCTWPSGTSGGSSSGSYTSSCSSNQYWNGSSCVPMTSGSSGGSSSTSCGTGMYWSGSTCVNSGSSSYSSDPQTACAQAGGNWNITGNTCVMPSNQSGTVADTQPARILDIIKQFLWPF
ncbi:MAG: hypothetical protein COV10_00835 [Candidatus Vogelbacteria bacterium CG10_big_fil_rev_8_21_14_0_10_51_16]|uniref:CARDB domain-containing protein n=1 Tax=Candidatus Vogelbacteria bacterium CG10_big_fil_rev_8_21_14_0_10_51_16 TaxID=1975045 RepID=A0A2H0RFQ1_9BACT|nr:MAG: hypothetical protein COV10_00835 [Candidatus Vogelbacteria bacterium CG10_big_fil_rev_8_21_14_0_10_51_16]